ncbi:hypothetical protein PpBr36_07875 [Pyricularia pennisetigena]|uniref:hypothetical protein n=1 Tax=Pyricularia pennisetigena TaxID=1578925 RepID=UPI001151C9F4|nr:hypothetical protein PpBr36_07875 [Pyricularia pennisetigena]TLS25534.1 hypothetical protein PpBr36_07875 [Pyricularia pennisetigena]
MPHVQLYIIETGFAFGARLVFARLTGLAALDGVIDLSAFATAARHSAQLALGAKLVAAAGAPVAVEVSEMTPVAAPAFGGGGRAPAFFRVAVSGGVVDVVDVLESEWQTAGIESSGVEIDYSGAAILDTVHIAVATV